MSVQFSQVALYAPLEVFCGNYAAVWSVGQHCWQLDVAELKSDDVAPSSGPAVRRLVCEPPLLFKMAALVSRLLDMRSQISSTRRSKTTVTLTLFFADDSNNSIPAQCARIIRSVVVDGRRASFRGLGEVYGLPPRIYDFIFSMLVVFLKRCYCCKNNTLRRLRPPNDY